MNQVTQTRACYLCFSITQHWLLSRLTQQPVCVCIYSFLMFSLCDCVSLGHDCVTDMLADVCRSVQVGTLVNSLKCNNNTTRNTHRAKPSPWPLYLQRLLKGVWTIVCNTLMKILSKYKDCPKSGILGSHQMLSDFMLHALPRLYCNCLELMVVCWLSAFSIVCSHWKPAILGWYEVIDLTTIEYPIWLLWKILDCFCCMFWVIIHLHYELSS